MTKLNPIDTGYTVNPDLPVIPLSMQVENAGCSAAHAHPRGQLIFANTGTMKIICQNQRWIVPPTQAVWVPPYIEHEVYFPGKVSLRNLFIDQSFTGELPKECSVITVNRLLSELIAAAIKIGENYLPGSKSFRLMEVLIDRIAVAETTSLYLPMGQDPRLLKVQNQLLRKVTVSTDFEDLCLESGASSRTILRLFIKETGMSFISWRTNLILQTAVESICEGESISNISLELGYKSLSAFIDMFRREMGVTPGEFQKNL